MSGRLPLSASVAISADDVKLHAPAAARNADAITALIAAVAPPEGRALELASGTGQHVTRFATECPGLHWHPSDVDPARIASIDGYAADSGLKNIAPAQQLDATRAGWAEDGSHALVVVVNLLHLISEQDAAIVLAQSARSLEPAGVFVAYGPFRRQGNLTSEGDARFDAELRAADADIGYKDDQWIAARLASHGLTVEVREMAANNLAFIARKAT